MENQFAIISDSKQTMIVAGVLGAMAAIGGTVAAVNYFKNKKLKARALVATVAPEQREEESFGEVYLTNVAFNRLFKKTENELAFEPGFHNGTGYFDPMTRMDMDLNQVVKTTSDDGRKIVVIGGGENRNVVVFCRYSNNKDRYVMQVEGKCVQLTSEHIHDIVNADDKYLAAKTILVTVQEQA